MNEYRSESFPVGERHAIRVYQMVDDAGVLGKAHIGWNGTIDPRVRKAFMPQFEKAQALARRWAQDTGKQLDEGGRG